MKRIILIIIYIVALIVLFAVHMMDSVIWWLLTVFCLAELLLQLLEGLKSILQKYVPKQKKTERSSNYEESEFEFDDLEEDWEEEPEEEITYVCSHCGGVTHGPTCEYCGVTLDEFR